MFTGEGGAEVVSGQLVSGGCFETLGVSAGVGRMLKDDDDRAADGRSAAVISYQFWHRRFSGNPNVIGRTLRLDDRSVAVVGVTPREFHGFELGRQVDVSLPLSLRQAVFRGPMRTAPGLRWLRLMGRRAPNVSVDQVEADLATRWKVATAEPARQTSRRVSSC